MEYEVIFTKEAAKDVSLLTKTLRNKLRDILSNEIAMNPFVGKKLVGDLDGFYSYRLSYKDRIVYKINKSKKQIVILKAQTHYGD